MEAVTHEFSSEPVVVAPLGDIQYDGTESSTAFDHLKRHLKKTESLGAYYLGLGDYIDFMSPSNRARLKNAGLYDTAGAVIDNAARGLTKRVADLLAPTRGRWLGLLTGHHVYEYDDGTNSDTDLCGLLNAVHLGDCAYVRLQFSQGTHSGSVIIWCHHGEGNGRTPAYPLTRLDSVRQEFDADIYIMGHASKRGALPVQRITPQFYGNTFRLRHREQWLVSGGCWSRGYKENHRSRGVAKGDYVEKGMMRPTALGAPIITITPRWVNGAFEPEISVNP